MSVRGMLAVLVFTALTVFPRTAACAIVEKWHTPNGTSYRVLSTGGDLLGNGSYEMITAEPVAGGVERVAVRSVATGALVAQSAGTYKVSQLWRADLDGNGSVEIIFWDTVTGKLNCLNHTLGSSAMPVRWSFVASADWRLTDFGGNGSYELITVESAGGTAGRVTLRLAATGALLAQTALAYDVGELWLTDLDADGLSEILFSDTVTHKLSCLTYTAGPNTLTVRWSFPAETNWLFVDLDGNGKLYLAFQQALADPSYFIYDRNGALVTTFHPTGAPVGNGWTAYMRPEDYDGDGRQELLIDYEYGPAPGSNILYVYESNTPVSVQTAGEPRPIELRASFPNPTSSESRIGYSLPSTGPASLRMFDVTGRVVKTLVDGKVQAGLHDAIWDGRDDRGQSLPAGAYFCELNVGGQRVTKRVVRLQ